MVCAGDVIENPVLGDTIRIIRGPADTGGELLQVEISLAPNAQGPPLHVHPTLEDRFIAGSGSLGVEIAGEARTLSPGEQAVAPPGVPHRFWNADATPATFVAEVRPASEGFVTFVETLYGLARDGKTNPQGLPNLLQAAVLFTAYRRDVAPASPPLAIQRVVFGVLAPLGRLLGYRAAYPEYSARATRPAAGTPEVS